MAVPTLAWGILSWGTPGMGPGTSHWGTLMEWNWDQSLGYPRKDMGPVEVLWDGDGVPQVWTDRHL